MRWLVIAILLATLLLTPACSADTETLALDDTSQSVSLELEFDSVGIGRIEAELTDVGSDSVDGKVTRRWIGLGGVEPVIVNGVEELPHAELMYDDATVVLVNGMMADAISAHSRPLELEDLAGWPAIVEYRRVEGFPYPLATTIDVKIPATWIEEAATSQR